MAKIHTLKKNGETIYPVTHISAVVDDNGNTVTEIISRIEDEIADMQPSENRTYELLLKKTFTEDVDSYDVSVDVPNITSYKDFIILITFKYQEGVRRGGWDFLLLGGDTYPKVSITATNIATESYRTHYVLRLHVGNLADMTAYFEAHNNSFSQPQINDGNAGINWMQNHFGPPYDKITSFVFRLGFINGENLRIYAR